MNNNDYTSWEYIPDWAIITKKLNNMNKDMIFFGKEGITSTSANTVANYAKEMYQTDEMWLNNIQLYSEDANLIGSSERSILAEGTTTEELSSVSSILTTIYKLKTLISWLREAIKARTNLEQELNSYTISEFAEEHELEMPIHRAVEEPAYPNVLTEDDVIGNMSIKERNRYFMLKDAVATIGKYIHPDGHFSTEREQLKKVISKPHKIVGSGRDTLVYNYTPTVNEEEADKVFFELQAKHRDYQKQFNSMNYTIEEQINESKAKANAEYEKLMQEYYEACRTERAEYNEKYKVIKAKYDSYIQTATQQIKALKIVIPDDLKEIFEKVSSIGKKNK